MATVEKLDLGPARLSEAARIAEMSRRRIEHGLIWRYRRDSIARQIRDSETAVVVARAAGSVVGFASMEFHFDARRAHLVLLAVEPAYRRRGVGVGLFRWLEKLAPEKLAELASTDELELTYTHLQSMNNLTYMLQRTAERRAENASNAEKPVEETSDQPNKKTKEVKNAGKGKKAEKAS